MVIEKVMERIVNLENSFNKLDEVMAMYQHNIDNNITWFYASLGVILIILLPALFFLVKQAVNAGIEKGILNANNNLMTIIQNEKQLYTAKGNTGALGGSFTISGLVNFTAESFVSLLIYKKISGEIVPFTIEKISDGSLTVKVDGQSLKDFDSNGTLISNGFLLWTLVWLKNENKNKSRN